MEKELIIQQIENYKIANRVYVLQMQEMLQKRIKSFNVPLYNSPHQIFWYGRKYNYYYNGGSKFTFVDILKVDKQYALWCLENFDDFIVDDLLSYAEYFLPLTDYAISCFVLNDIKLDMWCEYVNELRNEF